MTEKKRSVGNGIGIGAALGVAFGAAYGYKSGNISQSIALGLAIGVALGAIFDFSIMKKSNNVKQQQTANNRSTPPNEKKSAHNERIKMKELETIENQVIEILSSYEYYFKNLENHFWRRKENSNYQNLLLKFVDIFGFELSNLTMIQFYEEINEDLNYYYLGGYEANYLVLNKKTGKVDLIDYDLKFIFHCSKSGEAFFELFLKQIELLDPNCTMTDKDFGKLKEIQAKKCLLLAGGIEYKNWIELLY